MDDFNGRLRRWKNRVALVTGASSGIGRSTAVALAALGMRVAIAGRDQDQLTATQEKIESHGGKALVLKGDLLDPETPHLFFRKLAKIWSEPDVLINNAGVTGGKGFLDVDSSVVETCFSINVNAAIRCMREAINVMDSKDEAVIVNVSSLAAYRQVPGRGSSAYSASKHALRALSDGIRGELAERNSKIKLCLISPGLVDTAFHKSIETFGYRPLQPEHVTDAILYILSTPSNVVVQDLLIKSIEQVM